VEETDFDLMGQGEKSEKKRKISSGRGNMKALSKKKKRGGGKGQKRTPAQLTYNWLGSKREGNVVFSFSRRTKKGGFVDLNS